MRLLTDDEVEVWIKRRGLSRNEHGRFAYESGPVQQFSIHFEEMAAGWIINLARLLSPNAESGEFQGALLLAGHCMSSGYGEAAGNQST